MNANELADKLDTVRTQSFGEIAVIKDSATMLRKQAEEIKHLQEQFDKAVEFLAKANNWSRQ